MGILYIILHNNPFFIGGQSINWESIPMSADNTSKLDEEYYFDMINHYGTPLTASTVILIGFKVK
jgi:hypothetical protein